MVEVEKGEEEVQSQEMVKKTNKKEEDQNLINSGQSKNTEIAQTHDKIGVGDVDEGEENLQANVKVVSKSVDLSPRSIRDLNKERIKYRATT